MTDNQWEVLILKPTPVFLSFISDQLPEIALPDFNRLQADTTAYLLPRQANEEEMLGTIETNFYDMFKHELSRWMDKEMGAAVVGSFFDFLCCFKFESHSQIVLLEETMNQGHQILSIKPRTILLRSLQANMKSPKSPNEAEDYTTMVVKNFTQRDEVNPFMEQHYYPILTADKTNLAQKAEQWPKMNDYQAFGRYFTVEVHSALIHLH